MWRRFTSSLAASATAASSLWVWATTASRTLWVQRWGQNCSALLPPQNAFSQLCLCADIRHEKILVRGILDKLGKPGGVLASKEAIPPLGPNNNCQDKAPLERKQQQEKKQLLKCNKKRSVTIF